MALVQENLDLDEDFCRLSIDDFVSGREIKFDIYIRLSEIKYLKIAHQGENIRFLYMLKDDFRKYMGFTVNLSKLVVSHSTIPKSKKFAFLKHTTDIILENPQQYVA